MDNGNVQITKAKTQIKSRDKLRSSLKKSSRNTLGGLDSSDECEDITLAPPPRRVSFAASSTVKPFVNDPEKHTIWDNTYEEEIHSHTDSNNVISMDSQTSLHETKGISAYQNVNFNQTMANLESTLYNLEESMKLTDCRSPDAKSDMEFTCLFSDNKFGNTTQLKEIDVVLACREVNILDKENFPIPPIHMPKKTNPVKPIGNNSTLMKTITDSFDMELTCQYNMQKICATKNDNMQLCEAMDSKFMNATELKEMDVVLTCQEVNIIDKENVPIPPIHMPKKTNPVKPIGNYSPLIKTFTDPFDMELTCQYNMQEMCATENDNMHLCKDMVIDETLFSENACQTKQLNHSTYKNIDMSFTCKFEKENIFPCKELGSNSVKFIIMEQYPADMEFIDQLPEEITTPTPGQLPEKIITQTPHNNQAHTNLFLQMDLTNQTVAEMELTCSPTCQSPEKNSSMSTIKFKNILANIESKMVPYQRPQFDLDECRKVVREYDDLQDKVKSFLQTFQAVPPRNSTLLEKVKKLSLANSSYISNTSDSLADCVEESGSNENFNFEVPKTPHERVLDVFSGTEDHILKLEHTEENYYLFSTFAQAAWFGVDIHPEDGRVTSIKSASALKNNRSSFWPKVYDFIVRHTRRKLEMCNLKSALGKYFDMLSLLDHVKIGTEESFDFCAELWEAKKLYKTLKVDADGTVSFEIILVSPPLNRFTMSPPIWWTVQFKLASLESLQQDFLKATSKWGTINEEHLKTILSNSSPALDCVRRFIAGVDDYFTRTKMAKRKLKDLNTLPLLPEK